MFSLVEFIVASLGIDVCVVVEGGKVVGLDVCVGLVGGGPVVTVGSLEVLVGDVAAGM